MNQQAYFEQFVGDAPPVVVKPWLVLKGMYVKGHYATYQEASIALEQHRELPRDRYDIVEERNGGCWGFEFPWDGL